MVGILDLFKKRKSDFRVLYEEAKALYHKKDSKGLHVLLKTLKKKYDGRVLTKKEECKLEYVKTVIRMYVCIILRPENPSKYDAKIKNLYAHISEHCMFNTELTKEIYTEIRRLSSAHGGRHRSKTRHGRRTGRLSKTQRRS
jgi:hypothetical protein